jgi:hypothetical protein
MILISEDLPRSRRILELDRDQKHEGRDLSHSPEQPSEEPGLPSLG